MTVTLTTVFCHLLACIFYAVAITTEDDMPKTWVNTFDDGYLVDEPQPPRFHAYTIAYLWAMGIVCGQNSNVIPESMADR